MRQIGGEPRDHRRGGRAAHRADQRHPRPGQDRGRPDGVAARARRRRRGHRARDGRDLVPARRATGPRMAVEVADDLPPVTGDRDRLIQVVINLISNAVKFTPTGTITCAAAADRATTVARCSIVERRRHRHRASPGADQARVFEQFSQAGDTLTDKPRGTGLGLPICREIVEHHGGRLWVEFGGRPRRRVQRSRCRRDAGPRSDDDGPRPRRAAGGRVTARVSRRPARASADGARHLCFLGTSYRSACVVLRGWTARLPRRRPLSETCVPSAGCTGSSARSARTRCRGSPRRRPAGRTAGAPGTRRRRTRPRRRRRG